MNQVRNDRAGATPVTPSAFVVCRIRGIPSTARQINKYGESQASSPSTDSRKLPALLQSIRNKSSQVNCSEEFPLDSRRSLVGGWTVNKNRNIHFPTQFRCVRNRFHKKEEDVVSFNNNYSHSGGSSPPSSSALPQWQLSHAVSRSPANRNCRPAHKTDLDQSETPLHVGIVM